MAGGIAPDTCDSSLWPVGDGWGNGVPFSFRIRRLDGNSGSAGADGVPGAGVLDNRSAGMAWIHGDQGDTVIAVPDRNEGAHGQGICKLCQLWQRRRLQVAGNPPRQDSEPGPGLDFAGVIAHQQRVVFQGPQDPVGHGTVNAHGVGKFSNGQRRLRRRQDFQRPDSARKGL